MGCRGLSGSDGMSTHSMAETNMHLWGMQASSLKITFAKVIRKIMQTCICVRSLRLHDFTKLTLESSLIKSVTGFVAILAHLSSEYRILLHTQGVAWHAVLIYHTDMS